MADEWVIEPKRVDWYKSIDQRVTTPDRLHPEFGSFELNRHADVLPEPRTRVVLPQLEGQSIASTYINANYIRGAKPGEDKRYIAAMGPLPTTIYSFWRMVWHDSVYAIVMTTNTEERGKIKCERYWPTALGAENAVTYGDITVNMLSVDTLEGYTRSALEITRGAETRRALHFWYNTWPDHGIPIKNGRADTEAVTRMLNEVRETVASAAPNPDAPILVHCSAGVGRTGTFVGIQHAMTRLDTEGRVSLVSIVTELRRDRVAMVQTPIQYEFLHAAAEQYAMTCGKKIVSAPATVLHPRVKKVDEAELIVPMHAIPGFSLDDIGASVGVRKYKEVGTLAFMGTHAVKGVPRVGITFSDPIGLNDGAILDKDTNRNFRYFNTAEPACGVLTDPANVWLVEDGVVRDRRQSFEDGMAGAFTMAGEATQAPDPDATLPEEEEEDMSPAEKAAIRRRKAKQAAAALEELNDRPETPGKKFYAPGMSEPASPSPELAGELNKQHTFEEMMELATMLDGLPENGESGNAEDTPTPEQAAAAAAAEAAEAEEAEKRKKENMAKFQQRFAAQGAAAPAPTPSAASEPEPTNPEGADPKEPEPSAAAEASATLTPSEAPPTEVPTVTVTVDGEGASEAAPTEGAAPIAAGREGDAARAAAAAAVAAGEGDSSIVKARLEREDGGKLGLSLDVISGKAIVTKVTPGGLAESSGVKRDMELLRLNGKLIEGEPWKKEELLELMKPLRTLDLILRPAPPPNSFGDLLPRKLIEITFKKPKSKLGLSITGGIEAEFKKFIYILAIAAKSPLAPFNLRRGDIIKEYNGVSLEKVTLADAKKVLAGKVTTPTVTMVVARKQKMGHKGTSANPWGNDARTLHIDMTKETAEYLLTFGISLRTGAPEVTPIPHAHVTEWRDANGFTKGRKSRRSIFGKKKSKSKPPPEAVGDGGGAAAAAPAPSSLAPPQPAASGNPDGATAAAQPPPADAPSTSTSTSAATDPNVIEVTIDRSKGKLGFSIRERTPDGAGNIVVYISKLVEGGLAEQTGQLQCGMPLLAINGQPIPDKGAKRTKTACVEMMGEKDLLVLTVSTVLVEKKDGVSRETSAAAAPESAPDEPSTSTTTPDEAAAAAPTEDKGGDGYDTSDDDTKPEDPTSTSAASPKVLTFDYAEGTKLGLSLEEADGAVVARKVISASLGESAGFVVGMKILSINDESTVGASKADVLAIFKKHGTFHVKVAMEGEEVAEPENDLDIPTTRERCDTATSEWSDDEDDHKLRKIKSISISARSEVKSADPNELATLSAGLAQLLTPGATPLASAAGTPDRASPPPPAEPASSPFDFEAAAREEGAAAAAQGSGEVEGEGEVSAAAAALGLDASGAAYYAKLWASAETEDSLLPPGAAVAFLGKSGLDQDTLRTIWGLSDKVQPKGKLTEDEFLVACKLVAIAQAGKPVVAGAESADAPLPKFAGVSLDDGDDDAAPRGLQLDAEAATFYARLWEAASPTDGLLMPAGAVGFLGRSGLGQDTLRLIWSLSDTQSPRGKLTEQEFYVACKLVAVAQAGREIEAGAEASESALPVFDGIAPAGSPGESESDGGAKSESESAGSAAAAAAKADTAAAAEALGLDATGTEYYASLWTAADPDGDLLGPGGAVAFLGKSGLDQDTLRTIWGLSDKVQPKGKLTENEFLVACKLVAVAQAGGVVAAGAESADAPLPKFAGVALPEGVFAASLGLDAAAVEYYGRLWAAAGPEGGFLMPGGAVAFLGTSGLDQDVLRTIWGLSDKVPPKGRLSENEFMVACKLVAVAQAGKDVVAGAEKAEVPLPTFAGIEA